MLGLAVPTRCATRCSFQAKWLWAALRRIHGCCTETELLQHRQQASDVAEIAYEAVSHYTARLLQSRCASHGLLHLLDADHAISQALPGEHTQFDLGHVEPAAVCGGVIDLQF